ncbi:MAG: TonB-dependent siderophore receptor [Nostoc sp.]|uniref:TonB-dependent siderophore receptor n=1 Tax=Nostoc sp. TaxID=1180 RepID=UPI002FF5D136
MIVTGEAGVPTVELFDSPNQRLVFGVSVTATTAQQPIQTTPQPANQEEQKPIELEVIGTPDTGYQVPRTSVGTKTDTQLRDIPQTVQVIPRQLIEDRGANNSGEALRNLGIGAAGFPSRFNGEYQNSGSFIDFQHTQRYFVAPVISWQPGKDTKLTIEADYQNLRQSFFETGLPAAGTVLPNPNGKLSRSLYLGEQKLDQESHELGRISYYFEHKFNENWLLHNAFRFAFARNNSEGNVLPISLLGDNRTLTRRYLVYNQPRVTNTYELDTNVVGKFKTGSLSHQLLAGVDLYSLIDIQNYLLQNLIPINIFNPVYGQYTLGSPSRLNNKTRKGAAGFYLQDQIALTNKLKLVLGGRVDIERNKFTDFINSNNNSDKTDTAFSPRIGIIYQPIESVSLSASYSCSFEQVGGADINSNPFKPSRGTQYEIGVKTDLLNNKLVATLALYQITKNNITTTDPNNTLFNIQVGEQRSRGVELNLIGEILSGWNIIASYNYNDPRITRDNTYKVGNLLNNAPENSAALWTTYTIPKGGWKGFGGGIGVNYVDSRFGDLDNSFRLPSYVTADAAIGT